MVNNNHIKRLFKAMKAMPVVAMFLVNASLQGQEVVDIAEIIHASRTDKAENELFYDARKQISELGRWEYDGRKDTIYAIESWGLEDGCFELMYWDRKQVLSVSQDNMGDPIVAYPWRTYTKRIVSVVEEWDAEKARQCSRSQPVTHASKMYATRIILDGAEVKVDTMSFKEFFGLEDVEDIQELNKLWWDSRLYDYPVTTMDSTHSGDTVVSYSVGDLEFEVHYPGRPYDEDNFPDTAYKERLVVCGQSYMIDSLLFNNYSEYSGMYDFLGEAYVIENKYYIIDFRNGFQMGTMVQPCFLVFKTRDGKACPSALYMLTDVEDNSDRIGKTVRYYIDNGNLYLKGQNLELIRKFD